MRWHQRKMLDVAAVYLAAVMLVMVACRSVYLALLAFVRRALACCGVRAKPSVDGEGGGGKGDDAMRTNGNGASGAAAMNGSTKRAASGSGSDASLGLRRRRLSSADSSSDVSDSSVEGRPGSRPGSASFPRARASSGVSGGIVSDAGDAGLTKVFDDVD